MGFESGKRQREARWLKELYDDGVYDSESQSQQRGFSVHRSYPIIKSNTGKPTYLQLKWAIDIIRAWANGVATKRIPKYPSESGASKQKGGWSGEQAHKDEATEPEARAARTKVDRLPQVQARDRHAQVRRPKRAGKERRAPRVRSRG
jgi:hypothetical protein